MKKLFAFLLIALTSVGCSKDSVVVRYDGGKVRLTAVDDNIIRVEAVPSGEAFPKTESLSVMRQAGRGRLEADRDGGFVIARTGSVTAKVDAATGQVAFFDADGKEMVREHGREFSPIEVEGTKGWTVRQTFDSDADEGFFGLGQHQADEWNYKGRNEELYQYNTKISVPFIVSSKKYGILWESTSFCRWGDPRDYRQLDEVFTLYDRQGVEGALTGTYHPSRGESLVRREKALNQEYLRTPQCDLVVNSPEGFDFNGSHVVFEGSIEASESGLFHFYMYYAGYTKVFVDGKQVMPDLWRTAWNPNGRKFEYEMEAGRKTALRIEWEPDGGVSYCALKVLPPLSAQEQGRMSWWGEMQDGIDYYYIASDDIDGVISGYRTLTGKAPVLPKWTLGYWQSRERYTSQEQILSVLGEFRAKGIPIDNIVQDWQYWEPDQWGSHEFDATRFPDPKGMVDSIHAMTGRAHAADPSRPTTYGSSGGQAPNYGVDVFGYNYIVQNPIDRNHAEFPRNCAFGTEETTGCGTRGVYETVPEEGWMIPHNRRDSIDHIEIGWRFYKERPWLAGLCYWTGFDYRGESNPMVWPATGSQFGIFDYCGFPKDEAYYLKAWWTDEPVLHICGPAAGRVRVYSNCTIVELFADGVSLGAREMPRDSHLDWDVPGTASVFTAKGICADGSTLTDVYPEVVEGTELKVSKKAMKADGQDVVIIDIVSGQPVLDVCVEGAQFLGWGNGNPGFKEIERPVSGNSLRIRTFNGRAQVIIRSIEGMNGAARVTVRDDKGQRAAAPAVIACGECPDSELVERTMEAMTLREKVCQMFVLRPQAVADKNFFRDYPAGGFCLFAGDIVSPEQTLELTSELHSLPYRPLLCVDEEGGRVARIAGNGAFGLKRIPGMAALASDNDARKVYNAARYIGEYVHRYGFDVDFAPVADVNTNPENVVIGDRAFSDNPDIAATMVQSYLRGLSEEGVTGCLKHFPGHGDTKNDTHAGYAQSLKTWDEMKECETVTFRAGIAAGAEMIMTAHIAAPAVTGSDVPSTMSEVILGEKLRGELGFGGIIVTDALEMGAITSKYGPSEAALNALKAGADLILMPVDFVQSVDSIIDAVQSGEISEERIDGSVRRILTLKAKSQKTI